MVFLEEITGPQKACFFLPCPWGVSVASPTATPTCSFDGQNETPVTAGRGRPRQHLKSRQAAAPWGARGPACLLPFAPASHQAPRRIGQATTPHPEPSAASDVELTSTAQAGGERGPCARQDCAFSREWTTFHILQERRKTAQASAIYTGS